jgi:hypothetical protein
MAADPVEILNQRNTEVAQIRNFADLTDEAKDRRIAEVSERAQAEYADALEAREREISERAQKAERALFETPYPYAASDVEKAQMRALRRGAYESVYNSIASNPDPEHVNEELDRLLARAERTQDPELADAVYHVATERASGRLQTPTSKRGRRRKGAGRSLSRPRRRLVNFGVWGTSSSAAWRSVLCPRADHHGAEQPPMFLAGPHALF